MTASRHTYFSGVGNTISETWDDSVGTRGGVLKRSVWLSSEDCVLGGEKLSGGSVGDACGGDAFPSSSFGGLAALTSIGGGICITFNDEL